MPRFRWLCPAEPKAADPALSNKGNLAFRRPAKASSSQEGNSPEQANDGDADTRWCASTGSLPQWWQVDLGKPHDLAGGWICWEFDGRNYQYVVEGLADGSTWSVLCDRRKTKDLAQEQKLDFRAAGVLRRPHHGDRRHSRPLDLGQHRRGQALGSEVAVGWDQIEERANPP